MGDNPEQNLFLDEEFFGNFTSTHTRKSYRRDLNQFFLFCHQSYGIDDVKLIKRHHVIRFRNWLSEIGGHDGDGQAPKSIARKLAALSSYFDFLTEKSVLNGNPASSVKRPRREVKHPTQALSRQQVLDILGVIDETTLAGSMHLALLTMFFTTGLRKSEILYLKFKDFKWINQHPLVEFRGKGGKLGQKVLNTQCLEALENYLESTKENGREHAPEDWLFRPTKNPSDPKNLNKPLNPKTINEILEKYRKKIGLNFKISPHSARATFISELLDQGVDIYQVAREVNHSSVTTTQEYDKRRKNLDESPVHQLNYQRKVS